MHMQDETDIIQNLKDAGCGTELIQEVLQMLAEYRETDAIYILRTWRNQLLDHIHDEQYKLDALDYFLRKIAGGEGKKIGTDGRN